MRKTPTLKAVILITILGMIASSLAVLGPEPQAVAANAEVPVDQQIYDEIREEGVSSYWVDFLAEADLSAAEQMGWSERGWYVYEQLSQQAAAAQAKMTAYLDRAGIGYQAFWIKNSILVEESNLSTLRVLQSEPGVTAIRARKDYLLYDADARPALPQVGVTGIESNISQIKADAAWAAGYTGEGIVVANIDTGVRLNHQALVNQYRGNTGSGFIHDYNWFDPYGTYTAPADGQGHGTHTMGTMLGDDGGANQIGVAPDAQWIACRGCDTSQCSDEALLACAQFLAAPTTVGGSDPNPDMRAHIINNSWGDCGKEYDPWYQVVVNAWQAAGIYPIFSNGNNSNCGYPSPPGLNTVGNPARYGNVTAVGASGKDDGQYASLSNWGPSDVEDWVNPVEGYTYLKPQVLAPGVNIRSAYNSSDSTYITMGGTSMAAPHVAGVVALMWQAAPCLLGQYAATESILEATAVDIIYEDGSIDTPGNWPNYASGWGEVDALAAVTTVANYCGDSVVQGGVYAQGSLAALPGAELHFSAQNDPEHNRLLYNDENGAYTANLWADTYTITAGLYGFFPQTVTDVQVLSGQSLTLNFELEERETVLLSGAVYDGGLAGGSAHGFPLYAQLVFTSDDISRQVFSDPYSGAYGLELKLGEEYKVSVKALSAGYEAYSGTFTPAGINETLDYYLVVAADTCEAPGYRPEYALYYDLQGGDGGFTFGGTNPSWAWGEIASGPGAAHSGTAGWATNLAGNYNDLEDSWLLSPLIDLSGYGSQTAFLQWWDYLHVEGLYRDRAQVEFSRDGGSTWSVVWGPDLRYGGAYTLQRVLIDPVFNVANFRFRFVFHSNPSYTKSGWYVDDIGIGLAPDFSPVSVFSTNFDLDNGGFGVSGSRPSWEWGAPLAGVGPGAARSAPNVWATKLDGTYQLNERSYLTSPVIDLSAYSGQSVLLSFWQWMNIENVLYDYGMVQVSKDGGISWETALLRVGDILKWSPRTLVLDPSYAVSQFRLRFYMYADNSKQLSGWYIDELQVMAIAAEAVGVPCVAIPGAAVAGYVYHAVSSQGLENATVSTSNEIVSTGTSSGDPANAGLYWLFQATATNPEEVELTAAAEGFVTATARVSAIQGQINRQDFWLEPALQYYLPWVLN